MTTRAFAGRSALAGVGTGLVIMAGFAARSAIAISKHGGWRDAREFLGIGPHKKGWYKTWTR